MMLAPCPDAAPGIGHGGHLAEQKARYTAANSSRTGCAQAAAPAANGPVADGSEAGCPVVGTACWSADGDGVPAKQLLRFEKVKGEMAACAATERQMVESAKQNMDSIFPQISLRDVVFRSGGVAVLHPP